MDIHFCFTLISLAKIVQLFEFWEYLMAGRFFEEKKYDETPSITRERH